MIKYSILNAEYGLFLEHGRTSECLPEVVQMTKYSAIDTDIFSNTIYNALFFDEQSS